MKLTPTLFVLLVLAGCQGGNGAPGPVTMNDAELEEWQIALVEMRIEKNEAFMDSTQTPLVPQDLPEFEGLNYYNPEPTLRFKVKLAREARPDTIYLTKRKGQTVPYLLAGKVTFKAQNGPETLSVFALADPAEGDPGKLWLPFFDATNGTETYGGGRYLDLDVADDGTIDLDFNFAYNPLCDYNPERYNCTLPPPENKLAFPVQAGEKLFDLDE